MILALGGHKYAHTRDILKHYNGAKILTAATLWKLKWNILTKIAAAGRVTVNEGYMKEAERRALEEAEERTGLQGSHHHVCSVEGGGRERNRGEGT
jgi:hypothetical protein